MKHLSSAIVPGSVNRVPIQLLLGEPGHSELIHVDGKRRWVDLFKSMTEQWKRQIILPDRGVFVLDAALPMHVWHVPERLEAAGSNPEARQPSGPRVDPPRN